MIDLPPIDPSSPVAEPKTEALRVAAGEVVFRRFRCVVASGPDAGRACLAEGPELTIGTAVGNELELADPTVSRHHCAIKVTEQGFLLRDLGSTNGTTLGGFRVEGAYLDSGALIGIGASRVRFEVLAEQIREPLTASEAFGPVLGRSAAMRRIFAVLPQIASSDATALIEGPTGTGKGLLAEALHQASARANQPFVVVDCGAIPTTLMESELFGHEKGSFTGAHETRRGAFEVANGGTVFIDEVGELPLAAQPKLLRVLEKRVVVRVGSTRPIPLDVRVIAATNRDLRKEVNRGSFRADLFYRLNVLRLRMPALDERPEDIPLLVRHFFKELSGDPAAEPPAELVARLGRQTWGGNVRELRSAIEQAVLFGDAWSGDADAGAGVVDSSYRAAKARAIRAWETGYVRDLVGRHDGNLSRAARSVKMDRNHLRALLQRYREPS